jgi:hypothetical protein
MMNLEQLKSHAAELRAHVQRNGGQISAPGINQWISEHKLRDGGGLDENRLLQLAGLARQVGAGSGYVVVPVVVPIEDLRTQHMQEAVAFIHEKLARGPIPTGELNFPQMRFSSISFNDAMKEAGAAHILNAGVSECYALLPPR